MKIFIETFELTYPIFLSILLIGLAFFYKFSAGKKEIRLSFSFLSFPIVLKRKAYLRIIFTILSILSIVFLFVRDYSEFLSARFSYDVFYDRPGLENALNDLKRVSGNVIVSPNWYELRNQYLRRMDSLLTTHIPKYKRFFSYDNVEDHLVSHGKAEHKVEYFGFWQKYKLVKVSGITKHILHFPQSEPIEFETRYNLLEKPENLIRTSLKDFLSFEIVVQPTMAQSLLIHSDEIYEAELVGITHVRFFPYNSLEKTVFSFKSESGLVPLGYTYYRKED